MPRRTKDQNKLYIGEYNDICDVCGFKFKSADLLERWDGLTVCRDDWEPRHPMDFFRGIPDRPRGGGSDDSGQQAIGNNTDINGNTFPIGLRKDSSIKIRLPALTAGLSGTVALQPDWWLEGFNALGNATITARRCDWATSTFAAVYNDNYSINFTTGSEKYYGEVLLNSYSDGTGDYVCVSFRQDSRILGTASGVEGAGVYWNTNAGRWTVNRNVAGGTPSGVITYTTAPTAGDRIGVAVDNVNNKLYVNINGTWLTDGTFGGNPGAGGGWNIVNTNANCWFHATLNADPGSLTALKFPSHTPAGYTEVTA